MKATLITVATVILIGLIGLTIWFFYKPTDYAGKDEVVFSTQEGDIVSFTTDSPTATLRGGDTHYFELKRSESSFLFGERQDRVLGAAEKWYNLPSTSVTPSKWEVVEGSPELSLTAEGRINVRVEPTMWTNLFLVIVLAVVLVLIYALVLSTINEEL